MKSSQRVLNQRLSVPRLLAECVEPDFLAECSVLRCGWRSVRNLASIRVVVLAGSGVDHDLDVAVVGDVVERVRHLVVCAPVPHQVGGVVWQRVTRMPSLLSSNA